MMLPEHNILLIGQAPGPNTDPGLPLYPLPRTSAGGRLQQLTGLSRGEYLSTFDRVNLVPYFPGRTRLRDDTFPLPVARLAAQVMRPFLDGRTVIFVGRNVANAFDFKVSFHEWGYVTKFDHLPHRRRVMYRAAVVPHPSGRNHWYNKPENVAEAHAFWRQLPLMGSPPEDLKNAVG